MLGLILEIYFFASLWTRDLSSVEVTEVGVTELELEDPARFILGLLMGRSLSEPKIDPRSLFLSQGILMPESETSDKEAALRAAS